MLNRVVMVGRMVRDPELRRTGTGVPVASFTIAMNRNFTNQSGERQADFIPCVVWNKIAENTARYCSKGSLVGVEGRLQSRQYENQEGRKVTVIEVVCDSVQFLEPKSSNTQRPQQPMPDFNDSMYEMKTVDIQKEFDNSASSFDIMDDDIQF